MLYSILFVRCFRVPVRNLRYRYESPAGKVRIGFSMLLALHCEMTSQVGTLVEERICYTAVFGRFVRHQS